MTFRLCHGVAEPRPGQSQSVFLPTMWNLKVKKRRRTYKQRGAPVEKTLPETPQSRDTGHVTCHVSGGMSRASAVTLPPPKQEDSSRIEENKRKRRWYGARTHELDHGYPFTIYGHAVDPNDETEEPCFCYAEVVLFDTGSQPGLLEALKHFPLVLTVVL